MRKKIGHKSEHKKMGEGKKGWRKGGKNGREGKGRSEGSGRRGEDKQMR